MRHYCHKNTIFQVLAARPAAYDDVSMTLTWISRRKKGKNLANPNDRDARQRSTGRSFTIAAAAGGGGLCGRTADLCWSWSGVET